MSIGNLQDYGSKGTNFPWQLKMLQGIQGIITALTTQASPVLITSGIDTVNGIASMATYTTGGTSKLLTLSIYNQDLVYPILVSTDGGASYTSVPKGVTINYDAGGLLNYFDPSQIYINSATTTLYPIIIFTYTL
jgi:hypothetical protein